MGIYDYAASWKNGFMSRSECDRRIVSLVCLRRRSGGLHAKIVIVGIYQLRRSGTAPKMRRKIRRGKVPCGFNFVRYAHAYFKSYIPVL